VGMVKSESKQYLQAKKTQVDDKEFARLVDELGIPPDKKELMLAWDNTKKHALLAQHQKKLAANQALATPRSLLESLATNPKDPKIIRQLKVTLSSSLVSTIDTFIEQG
jgi:hypothetical protein